MKKHDDKIFCGSDTDRPVCWKCVFGKHAECVGKPCVCVSKVHQ
jgi:hypothetical protein